MDNANSKTSKTYSGYCVKALVVVVSLVAATIGVVSIGVLSNVAPPAGASFTSDGGGSNNDTLFAGQGLSPGQSLTSANGVFTLDMQTDGNLVLHEVGRPLWSIGQFIAWHMIPGSQAVMQYDGNLVVYAPGVCCRAVWASNTGGHASSNFRLVDQGDGNVVIYDTNGHYLWASGTVVPPAVTQVAGPYTYCTSIEPSIPGTDITTFKPCMTVTDSYNGTSAASRSIQPPDCSKPIEEGYSNVACKVTGTGSQWNGAANVDYVDMSVTWQNVTVFVLGGVLCQETITETDTDRMEVLTSPSGSRTTMEGVLTAGIPTVAAC